MKRSQSFDALIDRWGVSALQVAPRVLRADLPALGAAGFGETWWSPVRRRVGKSSTCSTWKTIGKPWENGETWENHRKTQRKMDVNPLANCPITMENHNFSWVNPLFPWPFSIAMLVYQRVNGTWLGIIWEIVYCSMDLMVIYNVNTTGNIEVDKMGYPQIIHL